MKSQMWWYMARSGGVVAWSLSAISVVSGLFLSSRVLGRRIDGPKLLDLHRFLGGLALVFTGVHLVGLVVDSTMHLGPAEVLVPFASVAHPVAVAWGVVALYLLLAVEITSLLRRRVGERVWRMVHYGGFGVFLFGTIHGLKIGTDVENPLLWWPAAGVSAAIVGLVAARIFASGDPVPMQQTSPPAAVERPGAELLQRTLEGLRQLEENPPVAPIFLAEDSAFPPPAPLTPRQAVSGSLFPSAAEVRVEPDPIDLTVPGGFDELGRHADPVPAVPQSSPPAVISPPLADPELPQPPSVTSTASTMPMTVPVDLPVERPPSGLDDDVAGTTRALPVRTPRRLSRTTVAATSVDSWRPASAAEVAPAAPPAPPSEVDPTTGEPDPQAYRKWLREWLAYVESQA